MAARDVYEGPAAALAALLAMAGTAAAGLFLLDAGRAGRLDRLTAAVVAMAAGGPADVGAAAAGGLPIAVQGRIQVMPLGVSVVGAVVLGTLLLRRGRSGLLMRGASAAVAFAAGLWAVAMVARGTFTLPSGSARAAAGAAGGCSAGPRTPLVGTGSIDTLQAGFSVAAGPAAAGAAGWALAVVGVCWLAVRFPAVAGTLRAARWPVSVTAAVCVLAAWAFGGPAAAGGVLLALPLVVCGALLLGLGVPWAMATDGVLSCALDGRWSPPAGGALPVLAADKVTGLSLGADDYVTKPFDLEELIARIRAILRRTAGPHTGVLTVGVLALDVEGHQVTRHGRPVRVSATEFRLLRYLMENAGRVVTKAEILDRVWHYDFGGDASIVDTYISYLRRKVDIEEPKLIHTVHGIGYVMREPRR